MYFMYEDIVSTSEKTRPFSRTYASLVISYKEVIDIYRNNRVDHTHTPCGQNTEFLNVTSSGTYNDLWALKGKYRNVILDWIEIFRNQYFSHLCRKRYDKQMLCI